MNKFLRNKSKLVLVGTILFLSSLFFVGQASAATIIWDGSGDATTFSSATNWVGDVAPGPSDQAMFASGGHNVTVDTSTILTAIGLGQDFTGTVAFASGVVVTTTAGVTVNAGSLEITTNNTLNIGADFGVSSTVSMNGGTINLSGNFIATTTFSASGGTINFNGASKTISNPGSVSITFPTVNINDDTTLASSVTTTGDITVASGKTFALATYNLITAGHLNNSGTITQSSGTVTMSGDKNLGGSGNTTLYNLIASGSLSLNGNVTTTNDLTITGTNFTGQSGSTDYYLVVGGNISVSQSFQFYSSFGHLHLTMTGNGKTFTKTGSAVVQIYELTIASGATTTLVGVSKEFSVYATTTVNGILNVGDETTLTLGGSGATALNVSGTLNSNTSTITFAGASPVVPAGTYYNLYFNSSANGTATFSSNVTTTNLISDASALTINLGSNSLVVGNNLTNNSSVITQSSGTVTMSGSSANLTGTGSTSFYNLSISGTTTFYGTVTTTNILVVGGVLNAATSTINLASTSPWLINGTLNINTSTIVYSGTNTVVTTSLQYYNLTVGATGLTLAGNATTTNNFSVNSGSAVSLGANNLQVGGSFSNSGTVSQSSGTVTMNGTGSMGGSGNTTVFNLIINGTTTLANTVTTTNILTINSSKVLNGSTATLILTSTSIPFVVNGTFNYNSSTVVYSGVGGTYISPTSSYYNLTINSTDAGVTSLTASVYVYNVFTINGAFYGGSNDVRLYGNGTPFVNSGTFTPAYGAITYLGTANVTPGTYFDLRSGNGGVTTLIGNVTSTNQFFVDVSSTLSAGSALITLSGNSNVFKNWGTFTAGTSEISLTNTVSSSFYKATFYKLTLGTGTYYFTDQNNAGSATSTNTVTNNGTLILEDFDFFVTGDFTNNGTTTYSGTGKLKKAATGGLTTTSYTSGAGNGTGNTITITVTDSATNLLAASVETKTALISATPYSDMESVTLTETGAATGVFSGTIPFNITNASATNNKVDVAGNGNLTLAYSNDYGTLTGDGAAATYSGSNFSSGGTGGGGGSSSAPSVSSPASAAIVSAGPQTNSQTITLNLSATNATQVAISENLAFTSASWVAYAPTMPFTLSGGAGEKTVYVKFRSASGVATEAYKVNITLKPGYISAVTAPASTNSLSETIVTAPHFEVSNLDSKVVISPVKTLVYKPNSTVNYTYSYKNETGKTLKVKVLRQVVDASGKAVVKVNGGATVAKGKTFKSNTSNLLSSKLADGVYTIQVKVMDSKNVILAENSFEVVVKKPLPPPSITANNPDSKVVITGLKVDYKPGSAVKYTYSYKNETGKPVKVKIVRQVVDANGKVLAQVDGTRILSKGQSVKLNATSSLSKKLAEGTYTAKVKVLDSNNVVLDENSFDFTVKK